MQRTNVLSGDVIAGALLAALGVYVVTAASQWTLLEADGPGPGFFPVIYGAGLIIGSLALVIASLRKKNAEAQYPVDWVGVGQALAVWAVFALMLPVMKYVGFAIAFAALIAFFLQFVFKRSWKFTILATVLTPIGFLIVFPTLLHVPLPVGQWTGF